MDKLNVILNGKIVEGEKGESVLHLAKRFGIEIPTLCNDERLEPFSSCYLCIVEIAGKKGLQPSCSTKISEGMKINTDNERIAKARKTALDLLLSNHYADCVAPCKQTCPAGVDVQAYIAFIDKGMYREAVETIKKTNPLPAICGRVCVRPCEVACRRNFVEGAAVGIDYLKRYASDIDLKSGNKFIPEVKPKTGKKAAVIGAGPGGLTSAYYLAIEGHDVEIFEASPSAGGMLRYGIPPYRLPNDIIDAEVRNITDLGPKIHFNKKLGENVSYKELKKKFDAVILTIGSQNGTSIGCEGDDAENVLSGIDFLRNMEMTGQKYNFKGKTVAVIGGGNTAMDCCRTANRCGAEKVYIIYRRTEKEMPANPIEIHESKLEGIEYMFLTAPAKVNKNKDGKLKTLTCIKMQLGEPDTSGRRRPVKIDGSEFDIELDIILAAIGQKTVVNFIDDINAHAENKLELTKWGDIAADKKTLQTSIKNVFAAGDGVTGPATLIEAIAQGRRAAISCHQYMIDLPVEPEKFEFISRRDNFQEQVPNDYIDSYLKQLREEMPTIDPKKRKNFKEVELGYTPETALKEVLRCLECGCTEYFTCKLKQYATEYQAEQKKFAWDFKKYNVDFSHPFIEIDNNKCILCSRCIRICGEVINANALGLVNRGFETFVAPSMRGSLTETDCESCGMCISTCPTAAISENVPFKPGPFETDTIDTVCNYCSVGCEITLHHKNGFFVKAEGKSGLINKDGNLCKYGKFGYRYLNDKNRILKPLLKKDGEFKEISFEEAYKVIKEKIKSSEPEDNAVYVGARLSNEEMYLAGKLAKEGIKTPNLTSFHYMNRNGGYENNYTANVPFEQIQDANKIYLFGSEINTENPVAGFMINKAQFRKGAEVTLITADDTNQMEKKANRVVRIKSYYHLIKATSYYILSEELENRMFLNDNCEGFDYYKYKILSENYTTLLRASGIDCEQSLIDIATEFNNEPNAIAVFSEKHLSANASRELFNLCMITGKLGKTSSGLISLKEKNNAQGLFDTGIRNFDDRQLFLLRTGKIKNAFIFGEDPLGCAVDKETTADMLSKIEFTVVQDYFISDTAFAADLILPASLPLETGGSYTNTQKFIQQFNEALKPKTKPTYKQISEILNELGIKSEAETIEDIMSERFSALPEQKEKDKKFTLAYTDEDNPSRMFNYGCDYLIKKFDDEFEKAFEKAKSINVYAEEKEYGKI
jgi:formate dehydrogenase major subunit